MIVTLYGSKTANNIHLGLGAAKNTIISKKSSNESCPKLNFVQKSPGACMYISTRSRAMTLERLIMLKYIILY